MSTRAKPTGRIILAAALGAFAVAAYGIWALGGGADGIRAATRFTARFSFLWFVTTWSASALATLWPGGWRSALLFNRRGVGLGFATAHFIHAGFFITAITQFGIVPPAATVFGGGLGYVFVALMALTSHDYWVRTLGPKNWKLLHTIGASYVAFIFLFSYFGRLRTDLPLGVFGLSLLGLAIVLKLAAWAKKRRAKLAPSASAAT